MKNLKSILSILASAVLIFMFTNCQETKKSEAPEKVVKEAPKTYKMTTQIPENVITPDVVETSIGTLKFNDGFPTEETAQKVWDNLDFVRAVEAMIMTTPAASLVGFRRGIRDFGPDNETMINWKGRLDPRGLTANR